MSTPTSAGHSERAPGPARRRPAFLSALPGEPSLRLEREKASPGRAAAEVYTLAAGDGFEARVMTYGGILRELWVPGRDGGRTNVVLGLPTFADYLAGNRPYLGALIGRYANRIANASFALDGVTYRLAANDGPNCLHGGRHGFDRRPWRAVRSHSSADGVSLVPRYASPDGEEGFPGALVVEATVTVFRDGSLRLDFRAATDRPTVVHLTSHIYWNLAGEGTGSALDQVLSLPASRYLPVDAEMIPTGEVAPVAGTPLDFTTPTPVRARIRDAFGQLATAGGYDHHFVLDRESGLSLAPAARLDDPASGRRLELATTEPGLQVYAGNAFDGSLTGTSGRPYPQGAGIALETQHCPDSPNRPEFPSTVLRPGRIFSSTTVYRFSAAESP